MKYRLIVRAAARNDLDQALEWYDNVHEGLAHDFMSQVERTLDNIISHPLSYPAISGNVRRAMLHQFPYGVFYMVKKTLIVVISMFHTSRSPSVWQTRH